MDFASLLQTLPQDARNDAILQATQQQIDQLPETMREEARRLRDTRNNAAILGMGGGGGYEDFEMLNNSRAAQQQVQQQLEEKYKLEKLRKQALQFQRDEKEIILKDKILQNKIQLHTDDKLLEGILRFIYYDNQIFLQYPFMLFKALTLHPAVEFKFFDAMLFILKAGVKLPAIKSKFY